MDKNSIQTIENFNPSGLLCDKEAALIIEIDGYKSSITPQRETICSILRENNAANIQYSTTKEDQILQQMMLLCREKILQNL